MPATDTDIETLPCRQCSTDMLETDLELIGRRWYCQECVVVCHDCDLHLAPGQAAVYDDQTWCESCLDARTTWCSYGSHRVYSDAASYQYREETLCDECYDAGDFCHCPSCHEVIPEQDMNADSLCASCAEAAAEAAANDVVHDYSYSPRFVFLRSDGDRPQENMHFGAELEVEMQSGQDAHDVARDVLAVSDDIYCKIDSSLVHGLEVVTMPATLAYHQSDMDWPGICEVLRKVGCRSHDTRTCGLHVHVSRDAIPSHDAVKLVYFVNSHEARFCRLARRSSCQHAAYDGHKALAMSQGYRGRYEAVNVSGDETIEWRIFRGTLAPDTVLASIELVHATTAWLRHYSAVRLIHIGRAWSDFTRYVSAMKERYPHLIAYAGWKELI